MTSTTYRIAALTPAERLGNRPDECDCCDRKGLRHIVKLAGDHGIVWMGTGCAAKALYGPQVRLTAKVRNDMTAAEHAARKQAEMIADRKARYGAALYAFRLIRASHAQPGEVPVLEGCRRTYHTLGGADVLGLFPAWLERVATTGDFD